MSDSPSMGRVHPYLFKRVSEFEKDLELPPELTSQYIIGPILGSGQFSVVRKITHRQSGDEWALKIVDKNLSEDGKYKVEIDILKKVEHENVISLKEVYESEKHVFIIMELVCGGEMFDEIVKRGFFSERDAAQLFRQITSGIHYLHGKTVVHRDLKPENILFADVSATRLKIADFGLARILGNQVIMRTPCGTPVCVAPEVLTGQGYGKEVDLWALGVILYIMLCGYPPFQKGMEDDDIASLYEQILNCDYEFDGEYWKNISEEDLVSNLLVVDPKKRLSCQQLLAHPWIQGLTKDTNMGSITKMKVYNVKRKLKMIISSLFTSTELRFEDPSEEELSKWKEEFQKLDVTNTGKISIFSLKRLIRSLGLDAHDPKIKDLGKKYSPYMEVIDFDHFVYLAQTLLVKPSDDNLKRAFLLLDKNRDGRISYSDLHVIMQSNQIPLKEEKDIMEFTELNKKKLDFHAFYRLLHTESELDLLATKEGKGEKV